MRESRAQVEEQQLKLLAENEVDLVVLARYMQVLSPKFVAAYPQKIINVHHSFLPAFTGAKPYHAAFARGVKLIGATSHYVTEILDEGPIIEQDVARVSQNDQLPGLIQKGRDLERMVLSRAVQWHSGAADTLLCEQDGDFCIGWLGLEFIQFAEQRIPGLKIETRGTQIFAAPAKGGLRILLQADQDSKERCWVRARSGCSPKFRE